MERLGLWGDGTAFKSFDSFLTSITKRGLGKKALSLNLTILLPRKWLYYLQLNNVSMVFLHFSLLKYGTTSSNQRSQVDHRSKLTPLLQHPLPEFLL